MAKYKTLTLGGILVAALTLQVGCAEKKEAAPEAAAPASSAESAVVSPEATIRERFKRARPDVEISSVEEAELPGFYRVSFENGPQIYVSADGRHFFLGDLYTVTDTGFENLAESHRNGERQALLAGLKRDEMIIFSPEGETKGAIYVFTDVDCGYCQKLHQEVPQLNAMGIEVRYLAYPRAGVGSPTYSKMVSAWCADDRQAAMNALKTRQPLPSKSCDNPVAKDYELGVQMGVTGTPAIITTEGELIPGYVPAARLAKKVLKDAS